MGTCGALMIPINLSKQANIEAFVHLIFQTLADPAIIDLSSELGVCVMKIGLLTAGSDSPGVNAAIRVWQGGF